MKKISLLSIVCSLLVAVAFGQTYKTKDGNIFFNPNKDQGNREYSALSKEATAILKVETAEVALLVPMKTFHFNNALLEEHFNENYLHTNKFPNGTYKGKLTGFTKDMLAKDGTYNLSSTGQMTLHGVTKDFNAPVILTVKGKTASFHCVFKVKAEDHNIEIPGLVKSKLAEQTPLDATIIFALN